MKIQEVNSKLLWVLLALNPAFIGSPPDTSIVLWMFIVQGNLRKLNFIMLCASFFHLPPKSQ